MKLKHHFSVIILYGAVIALFLSIAYWGSAATSAVAQMIPMERNTTIVIDPGHGGVDGGATSCTGVLESKFNLDISLRLNDLFQMLGYKTSMIRTTDRSVYTQGETIAAQKVSDLRQRVKMVNETPDALLISIHQNTFSDGKYSGAQVFYGPEGESEKLASLLQSAFRSGLNPTSNRKHKKADGVYLMQHMNCTGVLIECGFLSNPQEEAQLRDEDYQKKICCVIAATVGEFLDRSSED